MPRILITTDHIADRLLRTEVPGEAVPDMLMFATAKRQPVAEVVTLSEIDGIYAIRCTGDGVDECPSDIEPGDTWSNFEDCVEYACMHIAKHEARS